MIYFRGIITEEEKKRLYLFKSDLIDPIKDDLEREFDNMWKKRVRDLITSLHRPVAETFERFSEEKKKAYFDKYYTSLAKYQKDMLGEVSQEGKIFCFDEALNDILLGTRSLKKLKIPDEWFT